MEIESRTPIRSQVKFTVKRKPGANLGTSSVFQLNLDSSKIDD